MYISICDALTVRGEKVPKMYITVQISCVSVTVTEGVIIPKKCANITTCMPPLYFGKGSNPRKKRLPVRKENILLTLDN